MKIPAFDIQRKIDADRMLREQQQASQPPIALTAAELLKLKLPDRKNLLSPFLPEQGLAMVYGPRGLGKTYFGLNCAYAVASGGEFLGWEAPESRRVLYLDGEMPAAIMQQRLMDVIDTHESHANAFRLVTPDFQNGPMLNLANTIDQARLEPLLEDVALIVVDNISTLCRGGAENDAESWEAIQGWALRQRARGLSVLFIHHAGKGGSQRGTSRREDVLDTVIALRRPADYLPEEGARFEVHFEKSRGFYGADTEPREAQLITTAQGVLTWSWRTLDSSTYERVVELAKEKLSQADIARGLKLNRSTISRHIRKAKSLGVLQ